MKLKLAVQEYLRDIEIKKYTSKTIRSYTVNLNVLLSFLETQNVYETEELTPLLMKEFALFMSKKGRKGTYINSLLLKLILINDLIAILLALILIGMMKVKITYL